MATREVTDEELAEATYNLMRANAAHVGDQQAPAAEWANLPIEEQLPWRLIAKKAPPMMEDWEGATFDVVAFNLFRLIQPPELEEGQAAEKYGQMHVLYHLMWQAMARFLHAVLDSEEGGVQDAFDVFHDWFKRKADAVPRVLIA